jgi:hypothetical protein
LQNKGGGADCLSFVGEEDMVADEHGELEVSGRAGWPVRHRPQQAAMAASFWLAGDVARCYGAREGCWSELGAIRGAANGPGRAWGGAVKGRGGSGAARAKRALWLRPVHARQPFDEMPGRLIMLGCQRDLTGLLLRVLQA